MTQTQKSFNALLFFNISYLLFFGLIAVQAGKYEFFITAFFISLPVALIYYFHKTLHIAPSIIAGLSVLGLLHVAGINIAVHGVRLYDLWFIQDILRYDNIIHLWGSFVLGLIIYSLLAPHLDQKIKHNLFLLALLIILLTIGVGVLNEIMELFAVVFLNAGKEIGDYMNNALDLLFNLLGAIPAGIIMSYYHRHDRIKINQN